MRDFSPQLGRASAMGFWTIGPVAGSLVTSLVALAHTGPLRPDPLEEPVRHFGSGRPGGVPASPCSRSRTCRPRCATSSWCRPATRRWWRPAPAGLTDRQLVGRPERPWRQILQWDLVGSPSASPPFLLVYYAAASLFTIYYPVIFKNVNGTNFTVTQANGLNTWFWGADIVALIVVGLLLRCLAGAQALHAAGRR